jgi:hypothetical protein
MPPHLSHLLQPLDLGCFLLLKRAYGDQIGHLIRDSINHITKLEFLPAFYAAYKKSITKENICASFRGAGLVPHNPEAVIGKLEIKLRTPTPPALEATIWEARTPSNAREIEAQSTLICDCIQRHKSLSPAPIIAALNLLQKSAERMAYKSVLMRN